jgi:dipeptidyl aminopeptidase/acylaminoacyl peptidase
VPSGSPAWSPDGKSVAYDSAIPEGGRDIWIVESTGGTPRRLTHDLGECNQPAWAPDGQHIFFYRVQDGKPTIWRIPAAGGQGQQITNSSGLTPRISADGKTIYFMASADGHDGIFAQLLIGGEPKQITPDPIVRASYHIDPAGIFYITPRDPNWCDIKFYDFSTRKTRAVAEIQRPVAFGLSVSPDRKTFLSSRPITGSDLMLIDHFTPSGSFVP